MPLKNKCLPKTRLTLNERLAVMDLGTNTFHLIVVEVSANGSFREIDRERIHVSLAEECISEICPAAFRRGINALKKFRQILYTSNVKRFRAIGTAALRTASNGLEFIAAAKNTTGISIELVNGQQEAQLIYHGVQQVINIDEPSLIMDIGGGSMELILADNQKVIGAQSFPTGIAVLFNDFIHSDPITAEEIQHLKKFLHLNIDPFFKANANYFPIKNLIGAAGSFEILNHMMGIHTQAPVSLMQFKKLYHSIRDTTLNERHLLSNIPKSRAEMIIAALLLTDFICEEASIEEIIISPYALKEGAILEMIKN